MRHSPLTLGGVLKKPIIVALGACFAFMALASAAWATITITQAPAGQPSPGYYKNLSPWGTGGTCPGNGGNAYASSDRIRLGFGWFANNPGGLKGFFQNTHGSVSITGTDTFSDSWARSKSGSPFVTTRGIT